MKDYNVANHKLPPHNLDAEQSILGVILIDNEKMANVLESISSQDFYKPAHQKIFHAMIDLYQANEPIDLITLTHRLKQRGILEVVGGAAYLASLMDVPIALHNVEYYGKIVKDKSVLQALIHAASRIMTICYEDEMDSDAILGEAEAAIFGILDARIKTSAVHVSEVLQENIEDIEAQYNQGGFVNGLPSGFKDLDNLTTGFKPQELIIIAGRPGMGKTGFLLGAMRNAALVHKKHVAMFSMEMSNEQLLQRMIAMDTRIDTQRLRSGQLNDNEWDIFFQSLETYDNAMIFLDDTPAITPLSLRTKCRRLHLEYGLDLIIVDYLQLMSGDFRGDNRVQEVSNISRNMKVLARELNVPVLTAAQLSRAVEHRPDKKPQLSDLRESGSLEQDADIVMFIHRNPLSEMEEDRNKAELIVAKHRNGPTHPGIGLVFIEELAKFENAARDQHMGR